MAASPRVALLLQNHRREVDDESVRIMCNSPSLERGSTLAVGLEAIRRPTESLGISDQTCEASPTPVDSRTV